jgi:hypothetical protein
LIGALFIGTLFAGLKKIKQYVYVAQCIS